jgi:hypothetical protein
MVDKTSAPTKVIDFSKYIASKYPGSENASNNPPSKLNIEQIAQDIFTRMAQAAEALVENNSPENFRRLEEAGNSLLDLGNKGKESLKDKELILNHLKSLSEQSMHAASTLMTPQANEYVSNQLQALKINLEINGWDDFSLQELHQAPRNTRQPASVKQLFEILTETIVPESGRIMMYDNLAQLYDHQQNMLMMHDNLAQFYDHYQKMFRMNKKPSPDWDSSIVHMATFVLDIADEEFRQEKEYDKKELIKAEQPQMPQTEITVNDLRPPALDRFTQKRLEDTLGKKYNTDSEITLRVDFKENFLSWIKNNLHDFRALSLNGDPLAIFNSLCAFAKESQVLRKSLE